MKSPEQRQREMLDNALIELIQADADTEEEAIDIISKNMDLYNFSKTIQNLRRDIEMLRDEIEDVRRDELSDILNKNCCSCCCHK